jgi:hypothetical protein
MIDLKATAGEIIHRSGSVTAKTHTIPRKNRAALQKSRAGFLDDHCFGRSKASKTSVLEAPATILRLVCSCSFTRHELEQN